MTITIPPAANHVGELKFINSDAIPKTVTVTCSKGSVASIMAWYGSHYSGDRYAVWFDGEPIPKDRNGEKL